MAELSMVTTHCKLSLILNSSQDLLEFVGDLGLGGGFHHSFVFDLSPI